MIVKVVCTNCAEDGVDSSEWFDIAELWHITIHDVCDTVSPRCREFVVTDTMGVPSELLAGHDMSDVEQWIAFSTYIHSALSRSKVPMTTGAKIAWAIAHNEHVETSNWPKVEYWLQRALYLGTAIGSKGKSSPNVITQVYDGVTYVFTEG